MTDVSTQRQLTQASSQLPVDLYFDPVQYAKEQTIIFDGLPRYIAHELAVPNIGDYYTLPQESEGRVLIRNADSISLLSNVCRHRQAIMLKGRGHTGPSPGNIVCPLHRWTYNTEGKLLGAPHFEQSPCLNLQRFDLQRWNGLLFEAGKTSIAEQMAGLKAAERFNFEGYLLDHVEVHECNYNWKTFIEVYLEDYHVGPFHPGLGQFVSCDDLQWEFGQHYSVQTVGVNEALATAGSPIYRRWHDQLMKYRTGRFENLTPEYGAIWLTCYPLVMLEWYPHVLTVSTLHPKGPRHTTNIIEFFYPEEIVLFEREFIQAQQAAYMETCKEDDEIAQRMDRGREALMLRNTSEVGPYQSPMEDGMQHFHEWYRHIMGLACE